MRTHTHIRFITAIWSKWDIPVDSRQLVGLLYMNAFVNLSDNVFGIRLLYFKLVFQLHHKSLDRGIFLHCFGVSHGQTNLQENCTVKFITIKLTFVKANLVYRLTCPFLVGLICYEVLRQILFLLLDHLCHPPIT